MAVELLQVLVLGVIAAAAVDDVPVTWVGSPRAPLRAPLQCHIPDAERIPPRRPPPPLEGEERPQVKPYLWWRDGEELKRSSSAALEVSRHKEGLYQCGVNVRQQGGLGGLVLGYPVTLKFAYLEKQFSVQPSNSTAWRGQPYALTCDIQSGPPVTVVWLKDGELLPEDVRYYMLNNQLIITNVSDKDAGLYRCRATNTYANKTRTSHGGRLQVENAPEDLQPSFLPLHHEDSIEVPKGSRVVLPCPVMGNPKPTLIWQFTQSGQQRVAELESTDEMLVMPTIADDQEGVYVCRVDGNRHLHKTYQVSITVAVNITSPPEWKQVVLASTVRFNCTATGNPPPKVTWYKDGELLKLSGRIEEVPSVDDKRLMQLLIRSVTSADAGVYQCFARNSMSVKSAWGMLNVTGGAAAAPSDVRCWPAGAKDVLLKWKAENEDDIVAYIVQTTGPDGASLPGQPGTNADAKIPVSYPLTPYSFQVRAFIRSPTGNKNTASMVSDMSESVTCQGQGVPIKLSKLEGGSILVSWDEIADNHHPVVQWILQYKPENSPEHNVTLDGTVLNYTLAVSPSEQLQVRVLGTRTLPWLHQNLTLVPWTSSSAAGHYFGNGAGRSVKVQAEVTDVNSRNFTVRWHYDKDALPKSHSFLVCTRMVGGDDECLESYMNSAQVSNLQPDSEYEVRVQLRLPGQTFGGDFSKPVHVTTPPDGQQNVRNPTYKYINITSVRVSWNSEPKEYTVWYTNEYNLPHNQWTPVDAIGNTVVLTELDPTKDLYVRVDGLRPLGHSSTLTVPAQMPEAKNVTYVYTSDGIRVTWKGGGPRIVRYSQNLTRPMDQWATINVTHTSVEITGLNPSSDTYVMVAPPGRSSRSQVLTITPRPASGHTLYLGIGIGCGVLLLCVIAAAGVCVWHKRKRARSPGRRRRSDRSEAAENDGAEMRNVGGRLANGGGSKEAGEPLLNGHVHITENPSQSKTPNGKLGKGHRFEATFDVSRYDDADVTLETVIDPDSSTSTFPMDTSRRVEYDLPDIPFKLPDDNMNSELTRGDFQHGKVLPTLQPNG